MYVYHWLVLELHAYPIISIFFCTLQTAGFEGSFIDPTLIPENSVTK